MSAILVCRKRSSFFEESSPSVSAKRARCSASSSVQFSPPKLSFAHSSSPTSSAASLLDQLVSMFPDMEKEALEKALEQNDGNLDLTIKSLNQLRLRSAESKLGTASEESAQPATPEGDAQFKEAQQSDLPVDGAGWVELFVKEMMGASNLDDAKIRAARALEALEESICKRASAEADKNSQRENKMLKEQLQSAVRENAILKRAVAIQHERQKEFDERNLEFQNLKQMLGQYQEQIRTLEVNNYALTMHLQQAQQNNSIPGRFHPDIF